MEVGQNTVIEDGVRFAGSASVGHNCVIRSGAVIGHGAVLADAVQVTGPCVIGDYCNIRTGAIVSRGVILEAGVFVGPGVVTNHSVYPGWLRDEPGEDLISYVSSGSLLGSRSVIGAGVWLGPFSIVGAGAVVVRDIEGFGVWLGCPAKKQGAGVPEQLQMTVPGDAGCSLGDAIEYLQGLGYVWSRHRVAESLFWARSLGFEVA